VRIDILTGVIMGRPRFFAVALPGSMVASTAMSLSELDAESESSSWEDMIDIFGPEVVMGWRSRSTNLGARSLCLVGGNVDVTATV